MSVVAVLTADIVQSTQLPDTAGRRLRTALAEAAGEAPFEFFRGDSFQVLLRNPDSALNLALRCRCLARAQGLPFDVRCSIGIGPIDGTARQLATATGAAFLLSGRAFDALGEQQRLSIVSDDASRNTALRILAAYCDHIFHALTVRQAAVVLELLSGKTQTETAALLSVTQATISNHAHSAHWPQIEYLLREYTALCTTEKN